MRILIVNDTELRLTEEEAQALIQRGHAEQLEHHRYAGWQVEPRFRSHPDLLAAIAGDFRHRQIVEVPDDAEWVIQAWYTGRDADYLEEQVVDARYVWPAPPAAAVIKKYWLM